MLFRILSLLFFIIFITFFYLKIPYFFVYYTFLSISLIFLNVKEMNNFKKQLEIYKFDFYVREYENRSFLNYLYSLIVLIIILSLLHYMPFKSRELSDNEYVYIFLTLVLSTYLNWNKDNYDYYYFGKEFIKNPGKKISKIEWKEVKNVSENEKEELIIIELKNGKNIKIGTEIYYSFGKKKNEILTYIQNKI